MPFVLIAVIAVMLAVGSIMPVHIQQGFYALSLTVKSIIIFLLPMIIFSLLFKTMVGLASRATIIIAIILLCVICSNFTATFLSHFVGEYIYHLNLAIITPQDTHVLNPAWTWALPKWVDNNQAMFAGIILGIAFGSVKPRLAKRLAHLLDAFSTLILRSFAYLIPVFVAGFVVKLQFDGVINTIIKDYSVIFVLIATAQFGYIFLLYALVNRFNLKNSWACIRNILPAGIAGFGSMSSAAVMPLTIVGAASNAKNKDLAESVVPATVNIHLLGDCFAIPIFAYALMKSYGFAEPALMSYLIFVFYFVMAKFSVAAVPGGGIIIMLPILENYLGFTPEMLSLITALYILFDPVITCANVMGNGAFAKLIDVIASALPKLSRPSQSERTVHEDLG